MGVKQGASEEGVLVGGVLLTTIGIMRMIRLIKLPLRYRHRYSRLQFRLLPSSRFIRMITLNIGVHGPVQVRV